MITGLDHARATRDGTSVDLSVVAVESAIASQQQVGPRQPSAPTVANVLKEYQRQLAISAIASYYAEQIYFDFGGGGVEPTQLVQVGEGAPVRADPDGVLQVSSALHRTATEAIERAKSILAMGVPQHVVDPDFTDDDEDELPKSRVVPSRIRTRVEAKAGSSQRP